jgi:hypothetical protein
MERVARVYLPSLSRRDRNRHRSGRQPSLQMTVPSDTLAPCPVRTGGTAMARSLAVLFTVMALVTGMATARAEQTIVFLRHGEKPPLGLGQLDCQGPNRALALPAVLQAKFGKASAIYAPDPGSKAKDKGVEYNYIRPLATIEPTAIRLGRSTPRSASPSSSRWNRICSSRPTALPRSASRGNTTSPGRPRSNSSTPWAAMRRCRIGPTMTTTRCTCFGCSGRTASRWWRVSRPRPRG